MPTLASVSVGRCHHQQQRCSAIHNALVNDEDVGDLGPQGPGGPQDKDHEAVAEGPDDAYEDVCDGLVVVCTAWLFFLINVGPRSSGPRASGPRGPGDGSTRGQEAGVPHCRVLHCVTHSLFDHRSDTLPACTLSFYCVSEQNGKPCQQDLDLTIQVQVG